MSTPIYHLDIHRARLELTITDAEGQHLYILRDRYSWTKQVKALMQADDDQVIIGRRVLPDYTVLLPVEQEILDRILDARGV